MEASPRRLRPAAQGSLLRAWFTADLRSLAAMRIATAALVLWDLGQRSVDLAAHYTDSGAVPRAAILAQPDWPDRLSLHLLGGSTGAQALLFLLAAALAVLLLVGWRTRTVTVASFVLLVSLQTRNPVVLFGGDTMLKMLLFWGIFLPWGRLLSVDGRRATSRSGPLPAGVSVCTTGTAAAMLQIGIVYLFAAAAKTGPEWRTELTALYYALSVEEYVGPVGAMLYERPGLLRALTFWAFWVEALTPILLFFPLRTRAVRIAGLLIVAALQVGIGAAMRVGFFPVANLVALLVFVPGGVWARLGWTVAPVETPPEAPLRRPLADLVPVLLIGYILAWNLGLPELMRLPGRLLKIDQSWSLFAPAPGRDDGWWILTGMRDDGTVVNLLDEGRPIEERPPDSRSVVESGVRWRKLYRQLWVNKGGGLLSGYRVYLCRDWNARHEGPYALRQVEMIYMLERTLPDYRVPEPKPVLFGVEQCLPAQPES